MAATWLLLWVYVGLLVAVGWRLAPSVEREDAGLHAGALLRPSSAGRDAVWPVCVTTLSVSTLLHPFSGAQISLGVFALLVAAALPCAALLCSDWREVAAVLGKSALVCLLFAAYLVPIAVQLQSAAPPRSVEQLIGLTKLEASTFVGFAVWVLVLVVGAAAFSLAAGGARWGRPAAGTAGLAAVLLAVALMLSYVFNLRPIMASSIAKAANPYEAQQDWAAVAAIVREASDIAPAQDEYYVDFGASLRPSGGHDARSRRRTPVSSGARRIDHRSATQPAGPHQH